MGLALNALLTAKVIDPYPALLSMSPADFTEGKLELKEGIKFGQPIFVRALQ